MIPVAAIIMAMLVFTKCSKEDSSDSSELLNQEVSEAFQLKVGNNIKLFLNKVETYKQNPLLKNDETIQTDSALWYLESCFNYSYGFPNQFYKSFKTDTLYFTLDLAGNQRVSMTALTAKYEQMIDEVRQVYHASGFEQKGLSLINLQWASTSAESISFIVNVVTGEKTDNTPPPPVLAGPFGDEDNWWYGEMEGRCGEFLMDSDAAKQLMLAMNTTLPDPVGNFFVINPTTIVRTGGEPDVRRETDPNPTDNLYDYYLFFGIEEIGPVELCLYRNPMNTYYGYLRYLLLTKIRNEEFDPIYSLINVEDMVGSWSFVNETTRKYFHKGWFNYGIKIHYMNEPDYPIQLD
jgi:hypothetical protein